MLPLLGGIASAGIGGLASIFNTSQNNANSQQMQQQAEQFNQQQTLQQENFQTQMSNTAYQRASADMTAAGLNPMMMFGSGSAASTPSGGSSTIQPAQKSSAAGGVGSALQSGINTAVALKTADATIDNLVAQNAKIKAETLTESWKPAQLTAQTALTNEDISKRNAETQSVKANLPIIADEAYSAKNRSAIDPSVRKAADVGAFVGNAGSKAIAPISNLVFSAKGIKGLFPSRSTTETTRDDGSSSFSERYHY